ncbi:hypothetical protein NKH10_28595 [Mesorhizobium sp. M1340]|uniref:hypothetical protein n=1 Tax=unclassified Mesorhizobium TaxID=325217 RepID=UPI0033373957
MTSDFAAAHLHLERVSHYLSGEDETSRTARAAVDLLIDSIVAVQYKRPMGDVVEFPGPAKLGQSASGTG